MSLREDLEQLTHSFLERKTERANERAVLKEVRAKEDAELGKKHALEDIPTIVANIKQAAINGVLEYTFDIDQSHDGMLPAYGRGYSETVRAYLTDHDVGMYTTTDKTSMTTIHRLFIYWR